jgi:DNA-binding SARP family transcriptional activator
VRGDLSATGLLVVRLFGPLVVEDAGRSLGPRDLGGARPKQVLQILLAARGHRVSTGRLVDLLWPDEQPRDPAAALQTFVSVLRRHLVDDRDAARRLIVTEPEAYRCDHELIDLDLDRFDALLEQSSREPTADARRSLESALALVRGDVLEDEPYADWAAELRGTYQGRVLGARLEAADAALAELDYAGALAHAESAAALDRLSERAHRERMLALYGLGRQHDALAAYRNFRELLDAELGLEPTAETRQLEGAVLRQEHPTSLVPRQILRPLSSNGGASNGASMRLLGREVELGRLDRALRDALDGGAGLILVEAEAGLGKTRLLEEVATGLAGVRVGRATCSALERSLPYVPIVAALRDALDDAAPPRLGRARPEQCTEVDALEAVVELIHTHAPLVLVLDDLQWADEASLAALSYLSRRSAGVSCAFLGAFRTEEAPPDHPVRRLVPSLHLRLEPLSAADLAPLGVPGLHDSTGGNPRFVAETVAGGLADALKESLLAQCRAEGAVAYRTLLAASALEQPFDPEELAAVLGTDPPELVEELERLCERRILRIDGPAFRFRYGIVRDVLLASLSPARLRMLR